MICKFEEYLIKNHKSRNTIISYKNHIKCYIRWYKESFDVELTKLYRQNVNEYLSYLKNVKKDSAKTINAKIAALIKFNEYLQEEKIQDHIVMNKKDNIKIQQQFASPSIVSKREVETLRQKTLEQYGARNYAIVTIMAYAGLRISEVLGLKINDINLVAREIVVSASTGKGSKQRIVYINDKIIEAVKEYMKERVGKNSQYLFVSNRGNKVDRTIINEMFNKLSDKITPHTLRHFFCSIALEAGYSVHEVANQAGHSNIHTTLLYTNPTKEKMKEKANLL